MADNFRKSSSDEMVRSFDPWAHALTVISEEHRMIHDGFLYYAFDNELDVPDGASRNAVFRTGAKPPHFKSLQITASEGPVNVFLYENATITSLGAELLNHNANRLSSNVSLAKIYDDTSVVANIGNPFLGNLYVPANGNSGVQGATGLEELVLKPNTDYVFTFENDPAGSGTADIHVAMSWYELDYQS